MVCVCREEAIKLAQEAELAKMESARKALAEDLAQSRPKSSALKRGNNMTSFEAQKLSGSSLVGQRPASAHP